MIWEQTCRMPLIMRSHTLRVSEEDLLAQAGQTSPAIQELMEKLSAEDQRMRRLLPDPPAGHQWVFDIQRHDDLMSYRAEFRVVYRLKEIL